MTDSSLKNDEADFVLKHQGREAVLHALRTSRVDSDGEAFLRETQRNPVIFRLRTCHPWLP
jgi:hypothetical protein